MEKKDKTILAILTTAMALLLLCVTVLSATADNTQATPTQIATTTPIPTPIITPNPTMTPTEAPTPNPTMTPIPKIEIDEESSPIDTISYSYPDDGSFAALQKLANEYQLYSQYANQSREYNDNTVLNPNSPYPWEKYGYNDSCPYEMRYMWTHDKFMTVANNEADRYTLYEYWLNTITPHHDVSGKIELLYSDGRVIDVNRDAVLVDQMVGARITLTNNMPNDPIGRIDYKIQLCRYNWTTGNLECLYEDQSKDIEIGLVPGGTWSYDIVRQIPLLPGAWRGYVWVYNHDDDILLCNPTIDAKVAIDHGNGIISFG